MKFIENIADSDFVGSIQRYIEKVFEVLSSEYDKNPKLYLIASALIAAFVIAYISYSAGKRSRADAPKIKKHISYDEIDWSVHAESETEYEAGYEAAVQTEQSSRLEQPLTRAQTEQSSRLEQPSAPVQTVQPLTPVQTGQTSPHEQPSIPVQTEQSPATSPLELPRQPEEPADAVRKYLRGESGFTLADKSEPAPMSTSAHASVSESMSTLADKSENAPISTPAPASEPAPIFNLAPLSTPEPVHIPITESYEPKSDTPNNSDKQETESVKVEQINLIKAIPYRKFGPDNKDTNRSGRIFTEEELRKQIRD